MWLYFWQCVLVCLKPPPRQPCSPAVDNKVNGEDAAASRVPGGGPAGARGMSGPVGDARGGLWGCACPVPQAATLPCATGAGGCHVAAGTRPVVAGQILAGTTGGGGRVCSRGAALPASSQPCLVCSVVPAPVPAGLPRLVLHPAELLEAGAVLPAEQSWLHVPGGLLVAALCSHVAVLSNASQLRTCRAARASRSMPSSGGWQSCRAGCPWVLLQPTVPVPSAHVSFKKHSIALAVSPVKAAPRATAGTVQGEAMVSVPSD